MSETESRPTSSAARRAIRSPVVGRGGGVRSVRAAMRGAAQAAAHRIGISQKLRIYKSFRIEGQGAQVTSPAHAPTKRQRSSPSYDRYPTFHRLAAGKSPPRL